MLKLLRELFFPSDFFLSFVIFSIYFVNIYLSVVCPWQHGERFMEAINLEPTLPGLARLH